MAQKAIFRRRRANDDIDSALAYYVKEAGAEIAMDFVDQLEATLEQLSRRPAAGSPRYGHEIHIEGLRHWPMKRFPYLIFYLEREGRIEIARVLHDRMDIHTRLSDAE